MKFNQKEYDRVRSAERRERSRMFVRKHLEHHPCVRCGEEDWRVLEFHHRRKIDKRFSVGFMVSRGMPVDQIKEEMTKCDVMCSNCHRRHHYEEREMNESVKRERVYRAKEWDTYHHRKAGRNLRRPVRGTTARGGAD